MHHMHSGLGSSQRFSLVPSQSCSSTTHTHTHTRTHTCSSAPEQSAYPGSYKIITHVFIVHSFLHCSSLSRRATVNCMQARPCKTLLHSQTPSGPQSRL
jgi:hypothetical protein